MLQRDLEKALNLRPGAASQYERGLREPGFDLLLAIADHFDVSVDFLLGRPGAVKENPGLRDARRQLAERMNFAPVCGETERPTQLLTLAVSAAPDFFSMPRMARRLGIPLPLLELVQQGKQALTPEVTRKLLSYFGLQTEDTAAQSEATALKRSGRRRRRDLIHS